MGLQPHLYLDSFPNSIRDGDLLMTVCRALLNQGFAASAHPTISVVIGHGSFISGFVIATVTEDHDEDLSNNSPVSPYAEIPSPLYSTTRASKYNSNEPEEPGHTSNLGEEHASVGVSVNP